MEETMDEICVTVPSKDKQPLIRPWNLRSLRSNSGYYCFAPMPLPQDLPLTNGNIETVNQDQSEEEVREHQGETQEITNGGCVVSSSEQYSDDDDDDEKDIFFVDKILNRRVRRGQVQYLIKWQNYPASHNTWETEDSFYDKDVIREYEVNRAQTKGRSRSGRRKRLSRKISKKWQSLKNIQDELELMAKAFGGVPEEGNGVDASQSSSSLSSASPTSTNTIMDKVTGNGSSSIVEEVSPEAPSKITDSTPSIATSSKKLKPYAANPAPEAEELSEEPLSTLVIEAEDMEIDLEEFRLPELLGPFENERANEITAMQIEEFRSNPSQDPVADPRRPKKKVQFRLPQEEKICEVHEQDPIEVPISSKEEKLNATPTRKTRKQRKGPSVSVPAVASPKKRKLNPVPAKKSKEISKGRKPKVNPVKINGLVEEPVAQFDPSSETWIIRNATTLSNENEELSGQPIESSAMANMEENYASPPIHVDADLLALQTIFKDVVTTEDIDNIVFEINPEPVAPTRAEMHNLVPTFENEVIVHEESDFVDSFRRLDNFILAILGEGLGEEQEDDRIWQYFVNFQPFL